MYVPAHTHEGVPPERASVQTQKKPKIACEHHFHNQWHPGCYYYTIDFFYCASSRTAWHVQVRYSLQLVHIQDSVNCLLSRKAAGTLAVSSGWNSVTCEVTLDILLLKLLVTGRAVVSGAVVFGFLPSFSSLSLNKCFVQFHTYLHYFTTGTYAFLCAW